MLVAAKILFLSFFNICRLHKGPQDIPASRNLFLVCLFFYGLLSIALIMFSEPVDLALLVGLFEMVLLMLFSLILLQIYSRTGRWIQTVTALFGTGVVLNLFSLPVYVWLFMNGGKDINIDFEYGLWALVSIGLACWNVMVMAHILRHALEVTMLSAIIFSISYLWIVFSLAEAIMPAGGV